MAKTRETPQQYQAHETDLTRELVAYFQQFASSIDDPVRLELLLDELCTADDTQIAKPQADARAQQIQFVRNLLRDRSRVELLRDFYNEAMEAVYAVGGEFYAESATRLTELQADAQAVLERQSYQDFADVLAQIKMIADRAKERCEAAADTKSCSTSGRSHGHSSQGTRMAATGGHEPYFAGSPPTASWQGGGQVTGKATMTSADLRSRFVEASICLLVVLACLMLFGFLASTN